MSQPTVSGLQPMGTVHAATTSFSEESILQAFAEASNPIQMTVHNNNDKNPRFTILQQYISLIVADKIRLSDGKCLTCYFDPTSSTEVANKCHQHHIAQHGWTCKSSRHLNTWRCPICAQHIPIEDKKIDYSSEEHQEIEEVFNLHCKGCYEVFSKEDIHDDSESESDEEEEAQPRVSDKFGYILATILTESSLTESLKQVNQTTFRLILCSRVSNKTHPLVLSNMLF